MNKAEQKRIGWQILMWLSNFRNTKDVTRTGRQSFCMVSVMVMEQLRWLGNLTPNSPRVLAHRSALPWARFPTKRMKVFRQWFDTQFCRSQRFYKETVVRCPVRAGALHVWLKPFVFMALQAVPYPIVLCCITSPTMQGA